MSRTFRKFVSGVTPSGRPRSDVCNVHIMSSSRRIDTKQSNQVPCWSYFPFTLAGHLLGKADLTLIMNRGLTHGAFRLKERNMYTVVRWLVVHDEIHGFHASSPRAPPSGPPKLPHRFFLCLPHHHCALVRDRERRVILQVAIENLLQKRWPSSAAPEHPRQHSAFVSHTKWVCWPPKCSQERISIC